jgi:hypothetical protein
MALSTGSLIFTADALPCRSTVSAAYTVPRASTSAARARTVTSTASQPAGLRMRRSKPLALTDLSSQAQT